MFNQLFKHPLHLVFLFTRPLTIGVRALCYNSEYDTILLVKHTYSEGWALPGGGVELGESTLSALQRELYEEAGLTCNSAKVLDVYHNSSISQRDHVVIYSVEHWQEDQAHQLPTLEIAKKAWFKLSELPEGLTPCSEYAIAHFQQSAPVDE